MLEDIEGQIERVTFHNDENGFSIARLKVRGFRELVTVVGNLLDPIPGQVLRITGEWANHAQFGQQFKILRYKTLVPATVAGIEKYLGSGLIKGIGPVMAKRIVKKFGKETLEVIEETADRLLEVDGIGEKRFSMIRKAWSDQKQIREVMVFLQSHGVSSGYAAKIFKHYGSQSIEVVRNNPYRLAMDIFGIGFVTADKIAQNIGFEKESLARAEAGILYVLNQLSEDGHVYYPHEALLEKCCEILGVERGIIGEAMSNLSSQRRIVIENLGGQSIETTADVAVYLSALHACEVGIAARLRRLLDIPYSRRRIDANRAIQWVEQQLCMSLALGQIEAVNSTLDRKAIVITGGPGTGKTTIIKAILTIFGHLGSNILLAAPTGRAAKRMNEATGREAKTIHRLLEFSPQKNGFQKNEDHPLKCDLLIIDEASMIDTVLMHHLLKAVPVHSTLILVGDVNQLPSVGPGSVLKDIIESRALPVVRLTEIFRQARDSTIIVNAHLINSGEMPRLDSEKEGKNDFYFIENSEPEEALRIILELLSSRIKNAFRFDPVDDVQVMTPMNRGIIGTTNLNAELQKTLNPREDGVTRGGRNYRVDDKVMQNRNNYEKEVFNGDIGRITDIDKETQEVTITFEGRPVVYDYSDLDEVVLAYAISVHKAQGSEYPCVVILLLTQHYMLLQRNLLYTAITRGKKLVIVVGSKKALAIAVRNNKTQKRHTHLSARLSGHRKPSRSASEAEYRNQFTR
jgi:exodeoxyribonuclease V alpha subunit